MNAAPGPCVIVAEDERAMRELLTETLTDDGYAVVPVADGRALLRLLAPPRAAHRPPPALVVTDVRMPGLWGLDAIALAHETCGQVPTIVITAHGDPKTRQQALLAGACVLLEKPFSMTDFLHAAHRLAPMPLAHDRARTTVPADWPSIDDLERGLRPQRDLP